MEHLGMQICWVIVLGLAVLTGLMFHFGIYKMMIDLFGQSQKNDKVE